MGKVAKKPLPPRGSPALQSGKQNQKWPIRGQGGYTTPATWGVPKASERGTEAEVAHKWARWLHSPCRLGGPHRFKAGRRIRGCPQVAKVGTHPLPPLGSPPLQSGGQKWARWLHNPCSLGGSPPRQSGGQNQKWRTSGQGGYITLATWVVPAASKEGGQNKWQNHRWPTTGQGVT